MRAMGQPCLPRRQSRRRFPDRPRIGCGSRGSSLRACRPHLAAAISQSLSLSELMSVRCVETGGNDNPGKVIMGSSFTAPNEMRNSSRWYKAEIEGAAPECDKSSLNKKHGSVAIVADVNRCHQIKRTKFSAHTGRTLAMSLDFSSLFWIFIAIMVLQWGDG